VTTECVEKLIKTDMMDPISSVKLKDDDIIPIQRVGTICFEFMQNEWLFIGHLVFFLHFKGGTGFAGSGVELKSKKQMPVMIS
jgi:hypothetical protein